MIIISEKPIHEEEIINAVLDPAAGAVVTFIGTTRNSTKGRQVIKLEYEAYNELSELLYADIEEKLMNRYNVLKIAVYHRTGIVYPGEISVIAAVSAPHRRDAFQACEKMIHLLKTRIPIWKKEYYIDGAQWVEGNRIEK